jgi:lipopolysaccharide/colanic/teichoic acid biosynthesis glycosyltransferase
VSSSPAAPGGQATSDRHVAPDGPRYEPKPAYEAAKRALDIVLCLIALVPAGPLMLLIALLVRLDSRGPALFLQDRTRRPGRTIRMMKFRTMHVGAHTTGAAGRVHVDAPVERADPAITRLGRPLRASSLDELPQILNILRGDMSCVGPRPTIPQQAAAYTPREAMRLSVPPGLTGLAQVSGRNSLSWPERIELDLQYVQRRSFLLDCGIILRTPLVLLRIGRVYNR